MTKTSRLFALNICLISSISLLAACATTGSLSTSTPQKDWENAERQNTILTYQQFLRQYPTGEYSDKARGKIEDIRISQLRSSIASESMVTSFLRDYPNSKYALSANERLREIRFNSAKSAKTVKASEQFLSQYPNGPDSEVLRSDLPNLAKWEEIRAVADILISMAPRGEVAVDTRNMTPTGPMTVKRPASYDQSLLSLRKRLESGADPNAVKITGFKAPGREPVPGQPGYVAISFGEAGKPALPSEPGMTLLEYARANKMEDAAALLKAHGAN